MEGTYSWGIGGAQIPNGMGEGRQMVRGCQGKAGRSRRPGGHCRTLGSGVGPGELVGTCRAREEVEGSGKKRGEVGREGEVGRDASEGLGEVGATGLNGKG